MKVSHILLVILFSIGMGIGQLLLKYAANRQAQHAGSALMSRLLALALDWPFLLGAASYVVLLFYWVWLLTFLPLSKAYPFTLLSLAVATFGSHLCFHEPLTLRFLAGLSIISVGLLLLSTD